MDTYRTIYLTVWGSWAFVVKVSNSHTNRFEIIETDYKWVGLYVLLNGAAKKERCHRGGAENDYIKMTEKVARHEIARYKITDMKL